MKPILSLIISLIAVFVCVNESVAQGADSQMYAKYVKLVGERDALQIEIDNTAKVISTLKRAKAKKMSKQLAALQQRYDGVIRSISAFPQSITDPSYQKEAQNRDTEEFRNEMARKLQEKLSTMDMNKEATADIKDEELRRAYQKYNQNETPVVVMPKTDIYFSVQVASAKSDGLTKIKTVNGLHEVAKGDGTSYYYVGKFNSVSQADNELKALRKASNKYRHAFVVAFMGTKKISLEEAGRLK